MTVHDTAVRLASPGRVTRLVLEREHGELSIVFHLTPEGASSAIEVRCLGASDVRFRGEQTELKEIVLLLVEDISSGGWEGAKFRVKDYEEEFISFVCREIDPCPSH